jgi:hypothetical protein
VDNPVDLLGTETCLACEGSGRVPFQGDVTLAVLEEELQLELTRVSKDAHELHRRASQLREVLSKVRTAALGPEEALARLKRFGIEL